MCEFPYSPVESVHVGCGTCKYCRINAARVWQHRILCENNVWEASVFATLTYDEMYLPDAFLDKQGVPWPSYSVNPRALMLFMKRLRRRMEPVKIRFYGVGEYGDPEEDEIHGKGRPHYHVALFGVGSEYGYCPERKKDVAYSLGNVVEDSWKCGFVHIGEINPRSARYITNYITKFKNFARSKKLEGRHPEFSRMSNRPCGIGAPYMAVVAEELVKAGYPKEKIVSELQFGNMKLPLGGYLKRKLHELRGGDICAEFRESRARLFELGIEYVGWCRSGYLEKYAKGADYACVGHSPSGEHFDSEYHFHLARGKAKRFRIDGLEKVFRKRRPL